MITSHRCAERLRANRDRDEQQRRDLERERAQAASALESQRLEAEVTQHTSDNQRAVLTKQAEEQAKVCIKEAEEATRQKELQLQAKQVEENGKIQVAQEKRKAEEEKTKQKDLQLQIARVNRADRETDARSQIKLREIELKIAESECRKAEAECRKAEANAKHAQAMQSVIKTYKTMGQQQQQSVSAMFAGTPRNEVDNVVQGEIEHEQENIPARAVRRKAPWTALHCTLK